MQKTTGSDRPAELAARAIINGLEKLRLDPEASHRIGVPNVESRTILLEVIQEVTEVEPLAALIEVVVVNRN